MCKVLTYVACQRGASGRWVRSNGGSGVVGVTSRGKLGAGGRSRRGSGRGYSVVAILMHVADRPLYLELH